MYKIAHYITATPYKDIPNFNQWVLDNKNNEAFTPSRFNRGPKQFMEKIGNEIRSALDKRFEPSIPVEVRFNIENPSKDKGHVQINMVGDKEKGIPYRFIEVWYYIDEPLVLSYYDKKRGTVNFKVKTISDIKKAVSKINTFL